MHTRMHADLGWNDVGWRDEFKQIKTPKLDKMVAEESAILTNYYVYRYKTSQSLIFFEGAKICH